MTRSSSAPSPRDERRPDASERESTGTTGLRQRHLLRISDLSADEIGLILDTAESFKEISQREIKKVPTLRGRTVVNLFMEPSTRTRSSFEIAERRLSADSISMTAATSAVSKGETLLDTLHTLDAMAPDAIVIRHASAGSAALLARHGRAAVVNAGDGAHEHPTQALLDAMTIRDRKGRLDGLRVAIVGDLLHSRVLRSNVALLEKMGSEVRACGPRTLLPPGLDSVVRVTETVEAAIEGVDVVMMLRVQRERQVSAYIPSNREYYRFFGLTRERLALAAKDAMVMHPGPMNRGVEIESAVADGPASAIHDQVTNGVAVRMAVLYLLIGRMGGDDAQDPD